MKEIFKKIIEKLEENSYVEAVDDMDAYGDIEHKVVRLDDAIEIVRQEAEKYDNGWISCSERFPTTEEYQRGNGRFLVTDGNRTYEAEFDIYESHTFGKSRMSTDWFITDKCVTHW